MDNQQTQTLQPKIDYTAESQTSPATERSSTSEVGDGVGNSVDSGGKERSGDNQSLLDKGISYLQESIVGKSDKVEGTGVQGSQGDATHTAIDEAHPEKISEFLRDQNRSMTKGEYK